MSQQPIEVSGEAYDEHITVERDGEVITVPVTGVRREFYDSTGRSAVPEVVDFDRVLISADGIEAETWVGPNTVVVMSNHNDGWFCSSIESPGEYMDDTTVWERSGTGEKELSQLTEGGLSAAEALDFWMCHYHKQSATEWSEHRGVSPQAVSENVRNAREKLS